MLVASTEWLNSIRAVLETNVCCFEPLFQQLLQRIWLSRLTLPYDDDLEARGLEFCRNTGVSGAIGGKLRHPEVTIPFGRCRLGASLMRMPETSMDEQGPVLATIRQIR